MKLHELKPAEGAVKSRKRLGNKNIQNTKE